MGSVKRYNAKRDHVGSSVPPSIRSLRARSRETRDNLPRTHSLKRALRVLFVFLFSRLFSFPLSLSRQGQSAYLGLTEVFFFPGVSNLPKTKNRSASRHFHLAVDEVQVPVQLPKLSNRATLTSERAALPFTECSSRVAPLVETCVFKTTFRSAAEPSCGCSARTGFDTCECGCSAATPLGACG